MAPDKFRGTASAADAAEVIAEALESLGHDAVVVPLADGGEGLLDVLGGANRTTTVTDPLGDPVDAAWRMTSRTAVIEMARASGLALVGGAEGNDPIAASTYGTGELIAAALDAGAKRIVVGVGGSATTDGGLGALRALYAAASPARGRAGRRLRRAPGVRRRGPGLRPAEGRDPGPGRAARRRLERLVQVYLDEHGVDVSEIEGAGAAGGLAGGLAVGRRDAARRVRPGRRRARPRRVGRGRRSRDHRRGAASTTSPSTARWSAACTDLASSLGVPAGAIVGEVLEGTDVPLADGVAGRAVRRDRATGATDAAIAEAVPLLLERLAG